MAKLPHSDYNKFYLRVPLVPVRVLHLSYEDNRMIFVFDEPAKPDLDPGQISTSHIDVGLTRPCWKAPGRWWSMERNETAHRWSQLANFDLYTACYSLTSS